MSQFQELLALCQIEAVEAVLTPSESYLWRKFCRIYSKQFYTPLSIVEEMDPETVIKHVMESRFEDIDVEENIDKLLDIIYKIEDPDYDTEQDKSLDDFVAKAEQEEEMRLKEGAKVGKNISAENSLPKKEEKVETKQPTHGMINLDHLSALDSQED